MSNESENVCQNDMREKGRVDVTVRIALTTHQLAKWINGSDSTVDGILEELLNLYEFDEKGEPIYPRESTGRYVEYDDINNRAYVEFQFPARKTNPSE